VKLIIHIICIAILIGGWGLFMKSRNSKDDGKPGQQQVEKTDGTHAATYQREEVDKEGELVFNGMLMTFLTAGYLGVLFVVYLLPTIAHKFTHAVYDSGEMIESDPMHDARALVAQGDYQGAIEAFRAAAMADPANRLPWVEIVKLQRDTLEDPDAAIATLRYVLENHSLQENDAAYFLFRLAELHDGDKEDRRSAAAIMQQVIDQFPETRHSANARHKLHEWGLA
jgi:tetratricopeptide (TPR) repeat protein